MKEKRGNCRYAARANDVISREGTVPRNWLGKAGGVVFDVLILRCSPDTQLADGRLGL